MKQNYRRADNLKKLDLWLEKRDKKIKDERERDINRQRGGNSSDKNNCGLSEVGRKVGKGVNQPKKK